MSDPSSPAPTRGERMMGVGDESERRPGIQNLVRVETKRMLEQEALPARRA